MAVLARDEILKAINKGDIKISPYNPSNIGCASIDLTLGNEFRYYKGGQQIIPVKETTDYQSISEKVFIKDEEFYCLMPGQTCLGITRESIELSPTLCGLLEGRSRFARLGLAIHITAGFMNPGICNKQVLEIYNASSNALALYPGTKICQFIFLKMEGAAEYKGKFSNQEL